MRIPIFSFGKLFCIIIIFSSCSAVKQQNRLYKKITGSTPSYTETDSSVFLSNSNNLDIPGLEFYYYDSSIVGSSHSFTINQDLPSVLFLKCPGFITQNDNTANIFYTYPGSRLKAILNREGYIEFIDLNGNAERNNELNFFQKLTFSTRSFSQAFFYSWWQLDSIDYTILRLNTIEAGIQRLKKERLHFLDSIATLLPMSKSFKEQARSIINYASIRDSLVLYFGFKNMLAQSDMYRTKLVQNLNTINQIKEKPGYFFNEVCQTALNLLTNKRPEALKVHSESDFFSNVDTIDKYFKGFARDYLLFDQYKRVSKIYAIRDKDFSLLLESVHDTGFRKLMVQLYSQKKDEQAINKKESNQLISLDGKGIESMENLFKKHKGKLILLDFWASWCQPCREERPFLKKLEEEYKNKKVVFIYISLDKERSRWKVASLVDGLETKNSFKLLDTQNAPFIKTYQIDEIPRYMLIDKEGKMINSNAPFSGDGVRLRQLINENLKK